MIANYSTTIRAEKTAAEVQSLLAKAGARAIMTEYDDDGALASLAFQVIRPDGSTLGYRLPVRAANVLEVMRRDGLSQRFLTVEHARRVSWRIIKDWLRAQFALLSAEMVDLEEVFLPYQLTEAGSTMYQALVQRGFELPQGRG